MRSKRAVSKILVGVFSSTSATAFVLKALYVATSLLCIMMVFWIAIFPSSWLMGHSRLHDDLVDGVIVQPYAYQKGVAVPPATITKYAGHLAIQFSHILPGAFWAGVIPFQLHPNFRRGNKTLHRVTGYLFLISSLAQAAGLFLIVKRGLTYDHDYVDLLPMNRTKKTIFDVSCCVLAVCFAFTAIMAVVKARAGDIRAHRRYVIRHIGTGIWVAVQRIIVVCSRPGTEELMRDRFGDASTVAIVTCLLSSKFAIFLLEKLINI